MRAAAISVTVAAPANNNVEQREGRGLMLVLDVQ